MDVTTVGSNIYATTAVGKILSVVLAALGMMMFPIFTVYITDWVRTLPVARITAWTGKTVFAALSSGEKKFVAATQWLPEPL